MSTPRLVTALPLFALLVSQRAFAQDGHSAPVSASAPGPAAGDTSAKQEAARRFERAIKLYEDADYTLALAEFERVYELVPDYRVLYNIGQVSMQLGRYARAFRTLKEYVARGRNELPPDRAAAVQADLTQLAGKIGRLSVKVEQAGAQVSIDGVAMGRSPLAEPLVVDAGEHRVQIELSGYVAQSQVFTLAGGDQRDASFALELAQPATPVAAPIEVRPDASRVAPPPPQPSASSHRGTWLGVGWASTGVLAIGAIVSGARGASAAGELRDLRDTTGGATRTQLDQAQTRARTPLLIADVLGGAALITGGVTLYFQLSGWSREKAPSHAASTARLRLLLGANQVAFAVEN
jgi:tetratricopeptide (TPR) repeat protein